MASCRVLERRHSSNVEVCNVVCENIMTYPKTRCGKNLLFREFGANIFRVYLLCVLGWENSKSLDRLKGSDIFRETE